MFSFPTESNRTYSVNWSAFSPQNMWGTLSNVFGNGQTASIRDAAGAGVSRFYRVFSEAPLRYLTVGHVEPTGMRLALGLDRGRELWVSYSTNADMAEATTVGTFLVSVADDYTRAIDLSGLSPNTTYYFNVIVDRTPYYAAPYPSFRTARPYGQPGAVRFAFGSCFNGTTAGGFGTTATTAPESADWIWRAIAAKAPDFFLQLGDTAYCDHKGASDLRSYRLVHRHGLDERLANMGGYAQFRKHFPFYSTWDDHEIINDWPWSPLLSAPWNPLYFANGKQAFREYSGRGNPDPIVPGELYYTIHYGDVGIFMTDTRSFRSCQHGEDSLADIASGSVTITLNGSFGTASGPNWNGGVGFTSGLVGRTLRLANGQTRYITARYSPTQIGVSPGIFSGATTFSVLGKTILGGTQKQHLKNWLLQNKDTLRVKFIAVATAINGLTQHITEADAWGAGYQAELNEVLDFTITNNIRNVVFLTGDQHWAGSFNRARGGVNFFEFMSSPIFSFGYPRYTGTDPVLLSRINWMFDGDQNFGLVTIRTDTSPTTVTFELFSTTGVLQNSTVLQETRSGLSLAP